MVEFLGWHGLGLYGIHWMCREVCVEGVSFMRTGPKV